MTPSFSNRYGLLYQDCLDVFATIKDNALSCIFADPPFNLGKLYGNGQVSDALARRDYLKWSYAWLDECVRVLKPGAALFVYILPQWGYHFAAHLDEQGMMFRHWIALSMKGTFPRGRKLYPAHYALLYFTKGEPATFNHVRLPIPACRHCGKDIKDRARTRSRTPSPVAPWACQAAPRPEEVGRVRRLAGARARGAHPYDRRRRPRPAR